MRQLSQSLAANLAVLDKMFGTSADYYAKEITIYHCREVSCCLTAWQAWILCGSFYWMRPAVRHRRSRQASVAPGRRSLS